MDSLTEIDSQINKAKEKRKELILILMDGRSQVYVAEKTGIDNTKISRWINGSATLEQDELESLNKYLGSDFK